MSKGFTLIELIIVISIISLSVGTGYVTYARFSQANHLKKNSEDVGNLLTSAKQRAISRDMTPNTACTVFRGYEVRFTAPNTYQLRFICRPAAVDTFVVASPPYTLSARTVFRAISPNPLAVNAPFYAPFGCVDATFPDSVCRNNTATGTRSIQIQNQTTNQCTMITVNNVGAVRVGDPGVCI